MSKKQPRAHDRGHVVVVTIPDRVGPVVASEARIAKNFEALAAQLIANAWGEAGDSGLDQGDQGQGD